MSGPARPLPWPPDLLSERAPSRGGTALYVLALLALACWDLGGRSIFHRDMPRFASIAGEMIRSGDWLVPTQRGEVYANKPILYIWLVAGPSALFGGPGPFFLRLPSALAFVGTCLATAAWGRARTGSLVLGRLAGLLVATTWLMSELGRVGRPDMLATAFATAGAMLLDRAVLGVGRPRDALWAGLALGGGLLSKGPVALLLPLFVLVLPRPGIAWHERRRRARPLVVLGVALGIAALWLVPATIHGGLDFARRLVVDQTGERLAGRGNHLEAWWYYLHTLPLAAIPWTLLHGAAAVSALRPAGRRCSPDVAHLGAALLSLVVLSVFPTKEIRYTSILLPPFAVASAAFLSRWADRARDGERIAWHLGMAGGLATLLSLGALAPAFRWPASAPWVLPPALALLAGGLLALAQSRRRPVAAPRALLGRLVGLAVLAVGAGLLVYWAVLPRQIELEAVRENRAVASAAPAGLPLYVVGAPGLDTDDLYEAKPDARYARDPQALPSRAAMADLLVVCHATTVPAVLLARGGEAERLLERPRRDGTVLVLLRSR